MNPVIVLAKPNSLESRALTAWLWEWNISWVEQTSDDVAGKLMTVVDGMPFSGSFAQQRNHLEKVFGLTKPVVHD